MNLELTTSEGMHLLIAYSNLIHQYEEKWAQSPNEDHKQEREWYNDTLSRIAKQVSSAIHEDTDLQHYLSSQQTDPNGSVDVYTAIEYEHTK